MKKLFVILLSFSLLVLTGCSSSADNKSNTSGTSSASDGKVYTLKLGNNNSSQSITNAAFLNYAKAVEKQTNGRLKIDVYPGNQLGTNEEMVQEVSLGSLDMVSVGVSLIGSVGIDEANVMKVPFLFDNVGQVKKFINEQDGKIIYDKAASKNIKLLTTSIERMPREMMSKTPILTPEDLKGKLVRGGDAATNQALKVLKAVPTSVALKEAYTAFQQGVVDVVELPMDYLYDLSLYEVGKNVALTNHIYDVQLLAMSSKSLANLPQDLQKALTDNIASLVEENNSKMKSSYDDYVNKLKDKGVKFNEIDRSKFKAIVMQAYPELEKQWPSIKPILEKLLKK